MWMVLALLPASVSSGKHSLLEAVSAVSWGAGSRPPGGEEGPGFIDRGCRGASSVFSALGGREDADSMDGEDSGSAVGLPRASGPKRG